MSNGGGENEVFRIILGNTTYDYIRKTILKSKHVHNTIWFTRSHKYAEKPKIVNVMNLTF